MWRSPVGPSGRGPRRASKWSDYDPHHMNWCGVVDGRRLSEEFISQMIAARDDSRPEVNFVEQMRERKRRGTSEGPQTTGWPQKPAYKYFSSAEGA